MKNILTFILVSIAGVLIIGVAYTFVALINMGAIVLIPFGSGNFSSSLHSLVHTTVNKTVNQIKYNCIYGHHLT